MVLAVEFVSLILNTADALLPLSPLTCNVEFGDVVPIPTLPLVPFITIPKFAPLKCKSAYVPPVCLYETIYVIGDNDIKEDGTNPGAEFAKRVANEVINSVIVTLPPGMDINDYYLAHGDVATRALLTGERNE